MSREYEATVCDRHDSGRSQRDSLLFWRRGMHKRESRTKTHTLYTDFLRKY